VSKHYAQALRIAADLADENAELSERYAECLGDLTRARIERDDARTALLKTQAEVERLTKELDAARSGWAESLKWQAPSNGIALNSRIVGAE
jgi:predicted  nucleic acid-binding Zn-ribbon protein